MNRVVRAGAVLALCGLVFASVGCPLLVPRREWIKAQYDLTHWYQKTAVIPFRTDADGYFQSQLGRELAREIERELKANDIKTVSTREFGREVVANPTGIENRRWKEIADTLGTRYLLYGTIVEYLPKPKGSVNEKHSSIEMVAYLYDARKDKVVWDRDQVYHYPNRLLQDGSWLSDPGVSWPELHKRTLKSAAEELCTSFYDRVLSVNASRKERERIGSG